MLDPPDWSGGRFQAFRAVEIGIVERDGPAEALAAAVGVCRDACRENMDHLTRVLRSVNTSSMSVSNPMHSGAVARLAKLLREEVSRVNAERVRSPAALSP